MSSFHSAMDIRMHHREPIRDPLLDLILKKYSQAARDSIRGPVATKSDMKAFKNVRQANLRAESKDFKLKKEPDPNKLRETNLDGFNVGSFSSGGEKRLCFTELVQNVLKDYNVHEIFSRRDELLVYCSKCTPQQLDALKLAGILPWTSTSSNLITKSDAYRLWGSLYGPRAPKVDPKTRGRGTLNFEVYHECFGGCVGVFEPDLYTEPTSQCIRCTECNGLFSPKKFVSHNHTSFDEVHTCHWGFESSRWRCYLLLVEQKPTRELMILWDSVKSKFNNNLAKKSGSSDNVEKQDPDFVAFIKSPERKKATFSPIETLRIDREARLSSSDTDSSEGRPSSANEIKDTARHSAFHPWSPTHKLPSQRREMETTSQAHFIFPSGSKKSDLNISATPKPSHSYPSRGSYQHAANLAVVHAQCGCPAPLGSSPLYLSCQQCKNAAAASCSGLQLLAQKASERPGENDKSGLDSGGQGSCPAGCERCQSQRSGSSDSLESTVENILRKYMSSEVKQPNISDVSQILASELKKLHLSEEDKIRELTLQNQRLQAELHLMKMNYEKKFSESLETKRRVEQELEIVQREHQKDIARFNRITWEFQQEANRHKAASDSGDTRETIEALRKESKLLQVQLEQSQIEQENLRKQVQNLLHSSSYSKPVPRQSSNMDIDYPQAQSIVRHFPVHLKREADEDPMDSWRGISPYTSGMSTQSTALSYQRENTRDSQVIICPGGANPEKMKRTLDAIETSDESDVEIET
ncbi:ski oncogene-like [Rhopilema esculentum]|uniref:ski oncogene-like n=1 Tax=Rhopilema esculentum TaxID=499914 RepID=UPI0031D93DE4|eukprot:gene6825-12418_t